MVSERAFATESADIRPLPAESHFLGEEDEDGVVPDAIQESTGTAEASVEDAEEETVDLEAALGGNIRKAPVSETEPEPEAEPDHVEATA
jgi:small subunit ribosomal protein S2